MRRIGHIQHAAARNRDDARHRAAAIAHRDAGGRQRAAQHRQRAGIAPIAHDHRTGRHGPVGNRHLANAGIADDRPEVTHRQLPARDPNRPGRWWTAQLAYRQPREDGHGAAGDGHRARVVIADVDILTG